MKNKAKNKIKLFKKIRPDEGWKLELKNEIFEEKSIIFNPISFEKAFASLSLVGLVLFVVMFNTFSGYINELESVQPTHIEREVVEAIQTVEVMEVDKNKELLNYLVSEVDIYELEEYEKLDLAKESTRVLMEELTEVENRISNMITMME